MVRLSFSSLASFWKRIEHFPIGQMLKEGLDVYLPVVDDKGIDAVVRINNNKQPGQYVGI
ncbi:MAG: hypothetical protein IKH88_10315 [Prevotella sp.]|nr:hypothetical protein [Prevotella sp.]